MKPKTRKENIIVALDVGTTKVCTIIAKDHNNELEILGVGTHPSYGLKKGCVINIDKTVKSIRCSLEEAKLMSGLSNISEATIGIAGNHIYSFNSSGVVATKNKEVGEEDVERVLDAAKAVVIPSDREILHVLPQEFRVDNTRGIKDPIGMHGIRLEANVHIVTGQTTLIQNLIRCVDQAGIKANEIILQPVASSRSVLSEEEKELGVVLIDIGGGTTDLAVWKEGCLVWSQIIPVGGNHFTNDLAVALKCTHDEAERIKINHGTVLPEKINNSANILVQGVSGMTPKEVELKHISEILNARAEELLSIVKKILTNNNLLDRTNAGFVITGGGGLLNDMIPFAEYILEKSVKIGFPVTFGGMTNVMEDPKLSTVLGLLLESKRDETNNHFEEEVKPRVQNDENDIMTKFGKSLKKVFKEIF